MRFSMERWVGKLAVVTGASAGIGKAIVEQLVDEGVKVVGLARRCKMVEEHSKKLCGKKGVLIPHSCDVSNEESVVCAFKWIKENHGPISILVNNAGVLGKTNLIDGDYKIWKKIVDTNILGLCTATREAVRDMKANGTDGHIIHINSIVGQRLLLYFPDINVYSATKFAVTALTEVLRRELKDCNLKIKITSLSPAFVGTELFEANKFDVNTPLGKLVKEPTKLNSADLADAAIFALSTAPHVQIHEVILRHRDDVI